MSVPNIPGYNVVEMIREGGTATSWKAIQVSLKRPVVIKVLHTDGTPDDEAKVQSILAQIRKVSSLKHTGFLELIDIGVQNGLYYVVMGGSDGETVAELLLTQPVLEEEVILRVASDMAEALNHAWTEKHLYHGNLKPDNIMIHSDGSALISDMGLARREPLFDAATGETHDTIVGTPNYMSPEQVEGRTSLDCRTDIYSLGATLYQLATGKIPFDDTPDEETMRRQVVDCLPNPVDINPTISPALAGTIVKMMVKQPAKRYQSWSDVLTDINRARTNRLLAPKIDDAALSTVKPATSRASFASDADAPSPASQERGKKPALQVQSCKPRTVQTSHVSSSGASSADQQGNEKKSTIQIQIQGSKQRVIRTPSMSSSDSSSRVKKGPKSPLRTVVTIVQWLLVFGLWIYLAYVLLKPPVLD